MFAQDSIQNMWFCSYVMFLLRDQWLIERWLSKAMGAALVCNNFLPIQLKLSFHIKNKVVHSSPKFTKHKNLFWLLNWVCFARVVACFPQGAFGSQKQLLQTLKRAVFVLAWLTCPSSARERPQELGQWFCPLNLWSPSGTALGDIVRCPAGAQTWTQTWTLQPGQQVVKVFSPLKSQYKHCGVWILLSLLLIPNLRQAK